MSLVITSTTDTQAAIDDAAGLKSEPAAQETPETTPTPEPQPEPEEGEPDEQDDEAQQDQPKKKGGFQRKIEKLERELAEVRQSAIQRADAAVRDIQGQQPKPEAEPQEQDFQSYGEYYKALVRYTTRQQILEHDAEMQRQAQQWRAEEQQRQQLSSWQERVSAFRATASDYDDVLQAVDHVVVPPDLQRALMKSENGAQLAYELARAPKELERIAKLDSWDAIRELGKFEARLAPAEPKQAAPPVSRAPAPIRPLGQGAATSTVPMDQLPYQEYKRRREKEIAARRLRR